jgi:tRNA(Ile)-lysidine synthase
MSPEKSDMADRLVLNVERFILSEGLIPRASRVLVAVSGGADSTALLAILHRLSQRLDFSLAVGHFNHGLRESARAELDPVARQAESLRLPCHTGAGDVRAIARSTGDSIEEAARKARYNFLERTAEDIGADLVATGHTSSDHVETVLMRMLRGTGLRGLAGIPARRGKIVRPLLCVDGSDTVSYCETCRLPYVEDASNRDLRFYRNRVRHELLPLLEAKYDRRIRENLATLAANARAIIEAIREETRPLAEKNLAEPSPGTLTLDIDEIARLGDTALVVLFGDLFAETLSCDMDFTRVHYEGLVRLVRDPHASGKRLSLPGLTVGREHGRIVITRGATPHRVRASGQPPTLLRLPGETTAPGFVVTTEIVERGAIDNAVFTASAEEAWLDWDHLTPPLFLREPRPGDRMQPFGMTGTKKLSDIFIDNKIPLGERSTFLVLTDAHDVVWLVGVTTSEKCRVDPAARKVLRVRIEKK